MSSDHDLTPQLNRLHHQVKQLRTLSAVLVLAVIGLIGATIVTWVHEPSEVVVAGKGGAVTIKPGEIRVTSGGRAVMVDTLGLSVRDEAKRSARLDSSSLSIMNGTDGAVVLDAIAGANLRAHAKDGGASLHITDKSARFQLRAPGSHYFAAEANRNGTEVSGIDPPASP